MRKVLESSLNTEPSDSKSDFSISKLCATLPWKRLNSCAGKIADFANTFDANSQQLPYKLCWQIAIHEVNIILTILINKEVFVSLRPYQELQSKSSQEYTDCNLIRGQRTCKWRIAMYDQSTNEFQSLSHSQTQSAVCCMPIFEGWIEHVNSSDLIQLRYENVSSENHNHSVSIRSCFFHYQNLESLECSQNEIVYINNLQPNATELPYFIGQRVQKRANLLENDILQHKETLIKRLEDAVSDTVAIFMNRPEIALHEGSTRVLILALEAICEDGIKENLVNDSWPEAPYLDFLLQVKRVLRDDRGLLSQVQFYEGSRKFQSIGWTKARYFFFAALNQSMLHYVFENLVKRRSLVESFYQPTALLYEYSCSRRVVALLTALCGVTFLHDLNFEIWNDFLLPFNVYQQAPAAFKPFSKHYKMLYLQGGDPGPMTACLYTNEQQETGYCFQNCSIPAYGMRDMDWEQAYVGRGSKKNVIISDISLSLADKIVLLQLQLQAHDIFLCFSLLRKSLASDGRIDPIAEQMSVPERINSMENSCTEIIFWIPKEVLRADTQYDLCLTLDNSFSFVRSKRLKYRLHTVSASSYVSAWASCVEMAQAICWKSRSASGEERCEAHSREKQSKETMDQAIRDDHDIDPGWKRNILQNPVSFIKSNIFDHGKQTADCHICMTIFSYFGRQYTCPCCRHLVCVECSRHRIFMPETKTMTRACDQCFLERMKQMKLSKQSQISDEQTNSECSAYAALRSDPLLEKYFKMMSVGVPHSAVVQKLIQDNIATEKVSAFAAGPSGSDIMHQAPRKRLHSLPGTYHKQQPRIQFRKVHWTNLEQRKTKGTIWDRVTSRRQFAPVVISPHDLEHIVELFKQTSSTGTHLGLAKDKSKTIGSALDARRSRAISIALTQFKGFGGTDNIKRAIESCDLERLNLENIVRLRQAAPNSIEMRRYTNFRGSVSKLQEAEKFLVEMCLIPRVTEKLEAMEFVLQYAQQTSQLRMKIGMIRKCCYEILNSERLARFFELILTIGNLLNEGTELEDASGVALASLIKLSETKSVDQKSTLLQYLVKWIYERGEEDIFQVANELGSISIAKRYSHVYCISQRQDLSQGLSKLTKQLKVESAAAEKDRIERLRLPRPNKFPREQKADMKLSSHTVLLESIRERKVHVVDKDINPKQSDEKGPNKAALMASARSNLLESIRKSQCKDSNDSPTEPVAKKSQGNPNLALLASIQNHGKKNQSQKKIAKDADTDNEKHANASNYSRQTNAFVETIGQRLEEMQTSFESLDLETEKMVTAWENTARYLGESASSASDYVFGLLSRLLSDIELAKKLHDCKEHTASMHSIPVDLEVGSRVATIYGTGIVLALRRTEHKIELSFPWSKSCFLQPSAILTTGSRVKCKTFGIGFIRATNYAQGRCCVRFPFGIGFVRVSYISMHCNPIEHDTLWRKHTRSQMLSSGNIIMNDLVTTPFGRGRAIAVRKMAHSAQFRPISSILITVELDQFSRIHQPGRLLAYCVAGSVKLDYAQVSL